MKKVYVFLFLFSLSILFGQQSGELDPNFGVSGFVITNDENLDTGDDITVLSNDQIIMVGGYDNFTAIKLMPDGNYDMTFGNEGKIIINFEGYNAGATDVLVQPDGKIIMAGNVFNPGGEYNFGIIRLNSDGTLDTTFNGTGKQIFDFNENINFLEAVVIQSDGKILVAGQSGQYANADFAIARINSDGTFDTSFANNGKFEVNIQGDDRAKGMLLQQDGKIIIGGSSYPVGSSYSWFAAIRLTTSGQLDTTFSTDGKALAKISQFGNDTVYDIALQADGKILLLADSYISGSQDFGVVRFTTLGELDTTFSGDGKFTTSMINTSDYCNAIIEQPDGKILLAGSYYTTPESKMAVIRLTSSGELDSSFNSDGKASFVVPGNNGVSVYDMKLQSTGQILVSGYAQNNFMLARIFSGNELLETAQWNNSNNTLYPNPASDKIYFDENVNSVTIYSGDGKKIIEQDIPTHVDVSNLAKGIYFINIKTVDNKHLKRKIIID